MGAGQGALVGNLSYLAVGREVAYGTYSTCTAGLNFLSESWASTKDLIPLEEITNSRTLPNHIYGGKTVEGEVEHYFSPRSLACVQVLINAFGAVGVTSATATGDTAGASTFQHTIDVGNFVGTNSSLCLNIRKGQATDGKIFQITGVRVNELTLMSEIDDAVKMTWSGIGQDSTNAANDVSAALNTSQQVPLSFVGGRVSVETSEAAQTSTSYWNVQSVEFGIQNNLMSDEGSRRIGSDLLSVLPAGLANFNLNLTMRYDTTTAHDAMIANTRLYGELMFEGPTMTGSNLKTSLKLNFANLRIANPGIPEIGGPNEILSSEVQFGVMRDGSTTTGYAVRATIVNDTASY